MTIRIPSLARDFYAIMLFLCIGMVCLSGFFIVETYRSEEERITRLLAAQAGRLDRTLTSALEYTEHTMVYMGRQIRSNQAVNNVDYIYQLLRSFRLDPQSENLLSWSTFMWYNDHYQIIVEGTDGVLAKPFDLSKRDYIPLTRITPGVIQLGQPTYGAMSGEWIIPGGVGIEDHDGRFLGGIAMGFNIKKIINKLEQSINVPGVSFALLDHDGIIIGHSYTGNFDFLFHSLSQLALDLPTEPQLISRYSLGRDKEPFVYYQPLIKYPYTLVMQYDYQLSMNEILHKIMWRVAEFMLLTFIIITVLWVIKRRVISPILLLSSAADQIASGNWTVRLVNHSSEGEIGRLMTTFNVMLDHITSENSRLESQVAERTKELEHALALKTELMQNVSHEVRIPVQAIQSSAEYIAEHWINMPDDQRTSLLNNLRQASSRLVTFVSNLLSMSALTTGKVTYHFEKIDLSILVQYLLEDFMPMSYQKHLTLTLNKDPDLGPCLVFGDAERLNEVLRNILINAIRFSPKDGTITIKLQKQHDIYCISISDQGSGVPEEEYETIFDSFTQSSRHKTKAGGTGLGLSICRAIIAAHQGHIWCRNNSDCGTSFFVTLPLLSEDNQHYSPTLPTLSRPLSDHETDTTPRTLLVVDDEPLVLQSLQLMLNGIDSYKIITASGGTEALDYIQKHHHDIDMVLLDMMMPDMHGLDVLRAIRSHEDWHHIRVILHTGAPDSVDLKTAHQFDIQGILTKPYTKADLWTQLSKFLTKN
jgi:two-component system sensor histidine kinase ChiS